MDHSAVVDLSLRRGDMVDISEKVADHSNDSDTIDGERAWWAAFHADLIQFSTGLIGKHVTGYDEGDDMVDDSELVIQAPSDCNKLDASRFRVALYDPEDAHFSPEEAPPQEEEEEIESNPEVARKLAPFLTDVRTSVSEEILGILRDGPVTSAQASMALHLLAPRRKAIGDYVDAKIRFERQLYDGDPPLTRVLEWKREAFRTLHREIFTVEGIEFASEKKLRGAYNQYKRQKETIGNPEIKEKPEQ